MAGIDKVSTVTIPVKDQDEALRWFTEKLDFETRVDLPTPGMRWLTIAPKHQKEVEFALASWFPSQVGKNPPMVVETSDCRSACQTLMDRGVIFTQAPADKPYGVEAVFEDLYGNSYALVQRKH